MPRSPLLTVLSRLSALLCPLAAVCLLAAHSPARGADQLVRLSHGPVLGRVTANSVRIWARSSAPGVVKIRYGTAKDNLHQSARITTSIDDDNTGWIEIDGLQPRTQYYYHASAGGDDGGASGGFRTLPDARQMRGPLNPKGLYNFRFEFACGNNQNPDGGLGPSLPTYTTMLREIRDDIDFAILNGDWLYEEHRDYPLAKWLQKSGLTRDEAPHVVRTAPTVVGVWENYKSYLGRPKNLARWHRWVPSYFTFDDHEIVNDVYGSGEIGRRDRRAVFRDIGVAAWRDYLGWANPTAVDQPIHFGRAELKKGSDVLTDSRADFSKIDFDKAANLHVHWGTPNAGRKDFEFDDEQHEPNAGVYEVVKRLDKNRLQIRPPASADGRASYSIGRHSYGKFRVANCEFYLLDTRTHRQMHDIRSPDKQGLTMLGLAQRKWLMDAMKASDADFHFVVSSVNFTIPHVGGGGVKFDVQNKDDAWTVFLEEREMLIDFWDSLGKPVFVLTGDLHNSFAIKITDRVWEFASGPHNSVNHRPVDEGDRPVNGRYKYGPRECEIRWSSYCLGDIPRENRHFPHYCVVQVNNVFNNPQQKDEERWVAYNVPQVIFQYYDGLTGKLRYAETISLTDESPLIHKDWRPVKQGKE